MKQKTSRVELLTSRVKSNPIVASLIVLGTVVIAFSSFTDAAKKLLSIVPKQSPEEARAALGRMSLEYTPEAFLESAKTGDLTAIKLFLAAGMDPNAKDDEGDTALMYAAYQGNTKAVAALLGGGADVNQRKGRQTALRSAASGGHIDTVRALFDRKPDTESIDDAFVEAARTRHHEIARLLADRGAEVKKVGASALIVVASGGWGDAEVRDTEKFLIDLGADPKGQDQEGWTALMQVADSSYPDTARLLLDRGAEVNAQCSCPGVMEGGWTALMLATRARRREMAGILLGKGADAGQKNHRGETALLLAADSGDMGILQDLLDRNPDVNVKSNDGNSALNEVAAGTSWPDGQIIDHPDAVLALLAKGADVNARDKRGRTALMKAARSGSAQVVRALLRAGAHAGDHDVEGLSALRFAQENPDGRKRAEVVQLLRDAGAK